MQSQSLELKMQLMVDRVVQALKMRMKVYASFLDTLTAPSTFIVANIQHHS